MKRCLILMLILGVFCGAALSEALVLPDGLIGVEEDAFAGCTAFSSVVIPAGVTDIDPRAFSPQLSAIYGITGSAAQRFANDSWVRFVPIDIEIGALSGPDWVAPGADASFSVQATSPIWPLSYRYQLEKDGVVVLSGPWQDQAAGRLTPTESGVFDLRVTVRSDWAESSRLFPAAVTVGGPVRFAAEPLLVYVGEDTSLLAPEETRSVTFKTDNSALLTLKGSTARGLKPGLCQITATAVQNEGTVTTTVPVQVCVRPTGIAIDDLPERFFPGDTLALSARVLPANSTFPAISWASSDESVFAVDENGVLTARQAGTALLTATADGVVSSFPVRVRLPISALYLRLTDPLAVLYTDGRVGLTAEVFPADADPTAVTYTSADPRIAFVTADGTVTGVTPGQTTIICQAADGGSARAECRVTVVQGVARVSLSAPAGELYPGEVLTVSAALSPADARGTGLTWASDDESIAVVDAQGRVRPVGAGLVTISATAENGVRGAITLRVYDVRVPSALVMDKAPLYLNIGESYTLDYSAQPSGASPDAKWASSNKSVATVDAKGKVTALKSGTTTVTVTSTLDASVSASRTVTVLNPARTLIMPARQTSTSGITANINKIAAVKNSAFEELNSLYTRGKISASVRSARQNVISNAFSMYSFPWMTLERQPYWKAANSENGAKDFKPGIVYYGMPYISTGYYYQRLYNVSKALSENRYYSAGNYYILNQNNLYNGKYCGCDCSSMVAMCYFGTSASVVGDWNTHVFTTTKDFTTLSDGAELYPGDILVRDYSHVVMFLYYANSDHSQIVVIEQGGSEPGINTVSTSVQNASYYLSNRYIPRRYTSWK